MTSFGTAPAPAAEAARGPAVAGAAVTSETRAITVPANARLHETGGIRATPNGTLMVVLVAEFVPTLLALTLIALAHDGTFEPRRMAQVTAAAVVIGPVAASLLGFVGWLLMIALAVTALTAFAAYRRTPGYRLATRE